MKSYENASAKMKMRINTHLTTVSKFTNIKIDQ